MIPEQPEKDPLNSRKTLRHQQAAGREREKGDPREKAALFAIIKAAVTLFFLLILFFMLWKGIQIYEESVWMDNQSMPEMSPVLKETVLIEDFDISSESGSDTFAGRIAVWNETERLIRSVGSLLLRNNVDEAIDRCQQILTIDPAHIRALEYLGELYFQKEMYVEAVNSYIRLLSVDPSRSEFQLALLKSLDAYGDPEATIAVALWYQARNVYNEDVQRYLANAYFIMENFAEAATAYERVLKDTPRDVEALENQAVSYMQLEQYDKALMTLEKLVRIEFRDPMCHKRLAICHAQLGHAEETVQVMGKSAHLFGADMVFMWIQDPLMDPVRMDRTFQLYADTVVTEEYRRYLETMARRVEGQPEQSLGPRLDMPDAEALDADLLQPEESTTPAQ